MSKYKWVLAFNKIKWAQSSKKGRANSIGANFWRPKYNEYLQSPEWMKKRKECIAIHGDRCVNCSGHYDHVHHLNYERLGNECPEFDLIPLCSACHKKVHNPSLRDLDDFLLSEVVKPKTEVDLSALLPEKKVKKNGAVSLREQLRRTRRDLNKGSVK